MINSSAYKISRGNDIKYKIYVEPQYFDVNEVYKMLEIYEKCTNNGKLKYYINEVMTIIDEDERA